MSRQVEASESIEKPAVEHPRNAECFRDLSREVHDNIAHAILGVMSSLELIEVQGGIVETAPGTHFFRAKGSAKEAFDRIRNLAARLRVMAGRVEGLGNDAPIDTGERGFAAEHAGWSRRDVTDYPDVHHQLFLVVREAVINAIMHAYARRVAVDAQASSGWINVVVEDDGNGFEARPLVPAKSMGLASMCERVECVGGHFEIDSSPLRGTRITIGMPHGGACGGQDE